MLPNSTDSESDHAAIGVGVGVATSVGGTISRDSDVSREELCKLVNAAVGLEECPCALCECKAKFKEVERDERWVYGTRGGMTLFGPIKFKE